MSRSYLSDELGHRLTEQFKDFSGGNKEEFMHQIDGVTADIRAETVRRFLTGEEEVAYHYCTVLQRGRIFEVYSWGDDKTWHAKH